MTLRKILSNYYIQTSLFGLTTICIILASLESEVRIVMVLPFFALAVALLILNPSLTLLLFIGSFYVGEPILLKFMLLIDSADITLLLLSAALLSVLFTASKPVIALGAADKRTVFLLTMFIFISLLSVLLNIPSKKTSALAISIWYILNIIELIAGYLIFSRSFILNRRELFITAALILSAVEIMLATGQFLDFGRTDIEMLREVRGSFVMHHAMLGNMMVLSITFFLYRLTTVSPQVFRIAYFSGAVASLFAIIISSSRSALVGIFGAGFIWLLTNFKISRKYLLSLIVILLVIGSIVLVTPIRPLIINTIRNNQTNTLDLSSYGRILIWQGALVNFAQAPLPQKLFGIGIGNYFTMKYSARLLEGSKVALGAHNNLLHILTETGIAGLLVFSALFVTILVNLSRRSKSDRLCFFYFYATIALLLSGITQETFWFQPAFSRFWLFYMVFLGCCMKGGKDNSTIGTSDHRKGDIAPVTSTPVD